MGWDVPWYTITDDFDADHGVDEWHGTNVFLRDGRRRCLRTYFIHDRGDEALGTTWSHLDMTAFGRQEEWEDSPEGTPQTAPYHVVEVPRRVRRRRRMIAHVVGCRPRSCCAGAVAALAAARAWMAVHLRRTGTP